MRQWVLACVALALVVTTVGAVIVRLTPLRDFLSASTWIITVEVESVDAARPAVLFKVKEALKGKPSFAKMPVLVKGDPAAIKKKEPAQLLERVAPRVPLVFFVQREGKEWTAFGYTNGSWFQLIGQEVDGSVRWQFTHFEPYLRRTFHGTTVEMTSVVREVLAGKRKAPPADEKVKPGLGPPLKKTSRAPVDPPPTPVVVAGPQLAVVPTVLLGGPLAVLSMLFPTLFGGWKRWLALLSVACTTSTIYFLHYYFAWSFQGSVWASKPALWVAITLTTFLGTLWAWSRHIGRLERGEAEAVPSKAEVVILLVLSLIGVGVLVAGIYLEQDFLDPGWMLGLTLCFGAWLATVFVLFRRWRPAGHPPLATEAVMLAAMTLASVALMVTIPSEGKTLALAGEAGEGQAAVLDDLPVQEGRVVWRHAFTGRARVESSPLIAGDRGYLAVTYPNTFRPERSCAVLHAFDLKSRKELGSTLGKVTSQERKNLRMVSISSPWLADGRLYLGEGFHEDTGCNLYCFDAKTLEEKWAFPTESHTESSPCVADGLVYFGAGDDGIYAADARTGKKKWNYGKVHVDASPLVTGGRLYVGSGVGDIHEEKVILCLNAKTGKQIWRKEISHPAWGSPVAAGGRVYFGLGNGNFNRADENPYGALLCVKADTGEEVWRHEVKDGILARPALDRTAVYFGGRDGLVYCLDRKKGKLVWKQNLRSPVLGSVVLARSGPGRLTTGVYVAAEDGSVCCLGPQTGRILWYHLLSQTAGEGVTVRSNPALKIESDARGEIRRLFVPAALQAGGSVVFYELADRLEARE